MFTSFVKIHFPPTGGGPSKPVYLKKALTNKINSNRLAFPAGRVLSHRYRNPFKDKKTEQIQIRRIQQLQSLLQNPNTNMQRTDSIYLNRNARSIVNEINEKLQKALRRNNSYLMVKIINNHKFINTTIGGLEHTYISSCVYQEDGKPYSDSPKFSDEAIVALLRVYRDNTQLTRCVSSVTITRAKDEEHKGKLEISSWTVKNELRGREVLGVSNHNDPNKYTLHFSGVNRGNKNQGMSFNSLLRPLALRLIALTGKPMLSIAINPISIYLLNNYMWNRLKFITKDGFGMEKIPDIIRQLQKQNIEFDLVGLLGLSKTNPQTFANRIRAICVDVPTTSKLMNILWIHSMVITLNPAESVNIVQSQIKINQALQNIISKVNSNY